MAGRFVDQTIEGGMDHSVGGLADRAVRELHTPELVGDEIESVADIRLGDESRLP
ncbi:hypothetical protein ACFWNH_30270 [Rhodococcus qingshengii]|uniref:hypothetical protein n=1 Tax=Rhodococcus qingshengii TaxID=334542 RepID=UPI00365E2EC9